MAPNEIEMNKFSDGSTSRGGRVDELMLPDDVSHRSRSQQAQANEKNLDMALNLQKENFSAGPSGVSTEDDVLVHPVSESRSEAEVEVEGQGRVTFLEPIREENQDDGANRTHQQVGDPENTDHTVTEEEPADLICRTCGPDEEIPEEPDNLLVELGCLCRGSLSRMHRKCILEWYGRRICLENNYNCELCNAVLHGRIEGIVFRAMFGQDSGLDILIKALGIREPRPRPRPRLGLHDRRAIVEAATRLSQAQHADANAHPDFHQINIVDMTPGPAQRSTQLSTRTNWTSYNTSTCGGYLICGVVFMILVLIGFGVQKASKLH